MKKIELNLFIENIDNISRDILLSNEKYQVSSDSGDIIVLSKEEYDGLIETLHLSNVKQSLIDGMNQTDTIDESEVKW